MASRNRIGIARATFKSNLIRLSVREQNHTMCKRCQAIRFCDICVDTLHVKTDGRRGVKAGMTDDVTTHYNVTASPPSISSFHLSRKL